MKLYLAGPLFTSAERKFNSDLARELGLYADIHVWLPQDHEPRNKTAEAIFREDVRGIDWADIVVANMDGPDPDSGTCWECGYAYAKKMPIICYRTDMRTTEDFPGAPYNLMLAMSATKIIDATLMHPRGIAEAINHTIFYLRDKPDNYGGLRPRKSLKPNS